MKDNTNLPAEFKFKPLEEFIWKRQRKDGEGNILEEQVIGHYIPGMTYSCTKKLVHEVLRERCKQWLLEGKIEIISLEPGEYFEIHNVEE